LLAFKCENADLKQCEDRWDRYPNWTSIWAIKQGWPTTRTPRATFLTMLVQRATSCTWVHMNMTLFFPHIRLLSWIYC